MISVSSGFLDVDVLFLINLSNARSLPTLLHQITFVEQNWAQSHGFRSGQVLMLWKLLYGNNIWANSADELKGTSLYLYFDPIILDIFHESG